MSAVKLQAPKEPWRCGQECLTRRAYPNGKNRPADVCNRAPGHDGPHRTTDPHTFAVLVEWEAVK